MSKSIRSLMEEDEMILEDLLLGLEVEDKVITTVTDSDRDEKEDEEDNDEETQSEEEHTNSILIQYLSPRNSLTSRNSVRLSEYLTLKNKLLSLIEDIV